MNEPFNRADIPDPKRTTSLFPTTPTHEQTQKALGAHAFDRVVEFGKKLGREHAAMNDFNESVIKPLNRKRIKQALKDAKFKVQQGLRRMDKRGLLNLPSSDRKLRALIYKHGKNDLKELMKPNLKLIKPMTYSHLDALKHGAGWALYDVIADAKPTQTQEHEWNIMRNDPKRRAPNYAYTD